MINCLKNQSWRDIVAYIQVITMLLMVATFPIRMDNNSGFIPRLAMVMAGVFYAVDYVVNCRWKTWHWTRNKWFFVVMIAFYLLPCIWQIWANSYTNHFSVILEQRAGFVVCGVIGILGLNDKIKLRHVAYVFLATSLLTSVYIIYQAGGFSFFTHSRVNQTYLFATERIKHVSSHMEYNLYLNSTLIFAFYLLMRERLTAFKTIVVIAISVWIFYLLGISDGRIGQATGIIIMLIMTAIYLYRFGWKVLLPVLLVFAGVCVFVITHNTRMEQSHITNDPRMGLWQITWDIIKEKPIAGYGVCGAHTAFLEKLETLAHDDTANQFWCRELLNDERQRAWALRPHNSFLEVWSEFGVIGLSVLVFIFLFPLTMMPRKNRIFIFLMVAIFGIQYFFDMFMLLQLFGLSILFFTQNEKEKQ